MTVISGTPAYMQVAAELRSQIESGELAPGDKPDPAQPKPAQQSRTAHEEGHLQGEPSLSGQGQGSRKTPR
jgi:hypothetical protein